MPWLLRFSHVNSKITGGDSAAALQDAARGLLVWKMALERGILPDDTTLRQLTSEKESFIRDLTISQVQWPSEPLRSTLIRGLSTLGVARFASKYPSVKDALLKSIIELIVKHYKAIIGEDDETEERAVDEHGNVYKTAQELLEDEERRRIELQQSKEDDKRMLQKMMAMSAAAGHGTPISDTLEDTESTPLDPHHSTDEFSSEGINNPEPHRQYRNPNVVPVGAGAAASGLKGNVIKITAQSSQGHTSSSFGAGTQATTATPDTLGAEYSSNEDGDDAAEKEQERSTWTPERRNAEELVADLVRQWQQPIQTLGQAGKAFDGLEGLLASDSFDVDASLWGRRGWSEMDVLRKKLEDVKELRDLVRSLGRGGGWGPLRRAPVQRLDMSGRPGLLRTTLEAQETRGLTRSDDISRLLPSEAATLARGRKVRQSKLLFFAKLAEKGLQTYERDGWGEFPTQINLDRREIRPTADRGPILLCVDTSGSMRGAREVVAKALALECMRAAKAQDRGCYVFAFAGPQEVKELELNMDAKSVANLLDFLEKTFNGGSDFNAPVQKCLERLTESKWANSDVLLVSDGELRQPNGEIMRKLAGAKDKLSLRVHGLIVGSPEKKRADPAVLRALCSHIVPSSGKLEVLVHEFESWASVQADESMAFDWDDVIGNAARREAGLRLEKLRQAEMKRRRLVQKGGVGLVGGVSSKAAKRMPGKNTTTFD